MNNEKLVAGLASDLNRELDTGIAMVLNLRHKVATRIFKLKTPAKIEKCEIIWQKAKLGRVFRVSATVYHPCASPPYDEKTWFSKIAGVVIFNRAVLRITLRRV